MNQSEYLVNHGRSAFLGRFRNRTADRFEHGDRVVLRTKRGLEAGKILIEASDPFVHLIENEATGDILRRMDEADCRQEQRIREQAEVMIDKVIAAGDEFGLHGTVLDLELLLEGAPAIVTLLDGSDERLLPFRDRLARDFDLPFLFHVLNQPVAEPTGCGKPGCGSTGGGCSSCGSGGGCSTGSCSSGSVRDAGAMSAYFADLRKQMENQGNRQAIHG